MEEFVVVFVHTVPLTETFEFFSVSYKKNSLLSFDSRNLTNQNGLLAGRALSLAGQELTKLPQNCCVSLGETDFSLGEWGALAGRDGPDR